MDYSYTWMYNGSTLISTFSESNTSMFNLTSIQAESIGVYSCTVSNDVQPDGVVNLTILLKSN